MNYEYIEVDREVAVESAKRLVVDSIWKIANIELVRGVTFPQTKEIFEGRSPNNVDVETVVVINNLKHAWQFLFENIDYPLDYQLLAEYNKIVGAGHYSDPGKLRNEFVYISGTDYKPGIPTYEDVKSEIERISKIENPIDRGMEMLSSVSRGQWFNNGNKRTAQMITNHILLQSNSAVLAIPVDQQEAFIEELINFYESNDNRNFKDFLYRTSIEMLPGGLTHPVLKELILSDFKTRLAPETASVISLIESYPIEKLHQLHTLSREEQDNFFRKLVMKVTPKDLNQRLEKALKTQQQEQNKASNSTKETPGHTKGRSL
ncbi:hypothetical protein RyT2_19320 [Pseudolactococcus yaeyamensis]